MNSDKPSAAPQSRRVSYADHARVAAAEAFPGDENLANSAASEAIRLEPLHRIQVALDQLASVASARLRGEIWQYGGSYAQHFAEIRKHVTHQSQILDVAAAAARQTIAQMFDNITAIEDHMSSKNRNDGPQLTADGSPHPLEAGGYDADNDPQLPSNVSDVAALKEGKTTRKQSEAIAAGDAAKAEEQKADAEALEAKQAARQQPRQATKPAAPEPPPKPHHEPPKGK